MRTEPDNTNWAGLAAGVQRRPWRICNSTPGRSIRPALRPGSPATSPIADRPRFERGGLAARSAEPVPRPTHSPGTGPQCERGSAGNCPDAGTACPHRSGKGNRLRQKGNPRAGLHRFAGLPRHARETRLPPAPLSPGPWLLAGEHDADPGDRRAARAHAAGPRPSRPKPVHSKRTGCDGVPHPTYLRERALIRSR